MKNSTYIAIVLDRSGSMESIAKQTIQGFNAFLAEQKQVKGEAKISLVQFDHEYQEVYEAIDIHQAPDLNVETYEPRGMTALLDAIGKTIKSTKKIIDNLKDKQRPSKIIFVVITDGYENHSRHYSRRNIFEKISKLEGKHGWQFVFLGANQDAIAEAGRLGVKEQRAMTFAADAQGTSDVFFSLSHNISEFREKDVDLFFPEEQREKQFRKN